MNINKSLLRIVLSALLIMSGQCCFSQSDDAPFWVNGYFQDLHNSYIEVVSGKGYEYRVAKERANAEVIHRRSMTTGLESKVSVSGNDGRSHISGDDNLIVSSRVIDEYTEHLGPGEYKVYLLVQTAKNPSYKLENVSLTDKYPFSGRVFVPGMAQIYKGSNVKGGLVIAGTALGIGGIATCFAMKSSYSSLGKDSQATTCANIGYGCIAFTAAMYLYSLIDGLVAPGQKHLVVGDMAFDFKLSPMFDYNNGAGIALHCNF